MQISKNLGFVLMFGDVFRVTLTHQSKTQSLKMNQASNINGILFSRPHGGYRLAKQTSWGDEYIVFSYDLQDAWRKLSKITGRGVSELKALPITKF